MCSVLTTAPLREAYLETDLEGMLQFRRDWLKQHGELLKGPTGVTVAGLPAVRSVVDLGGGFAVQETVILDRMRWWFLECRFRSKEMKRGCDHVEETFEVA
jgi:hypothetical protein